MRIISQTGNLDLNYDQIILETLDGKIMAYDTVGTVFPIARYSTPEQAAGEMERLHMLYVREKVQHTKSGLTLRESFPKVFKFAPDEGERS